MQELTGAVEVSNLEYSGRYQTKQKQLTHRDIAGKVTLEQVGVRAAGMHLHQASGQLEWNKRKLITEALVFMLDDSDFRFNGQVENLFSYFIDLNASDKARIPIRANGSLVSNKIDLSSQQSTRDSDLQGAELSLSELFNLEGQVEVTVKELVLPDITLTRFSCTAALRPARMDLNSLTFQACDGSVAASGSIFFQPSNEIDLSMQARLDELDIRTLFQEFDDFDQQELTHQNLYGQLDATLDLAFTIEPGFELDAESMVLKSEVSITNGRLKDFKPLESLGKAIKMSYLQDIEFEKLSNQIHLEKGLLRIPTMDIQSSALNLTVSGKYHLNEQLNFALVLNLREILSKKFKSRRHNDLYYETDPGGGMKVHAYISGDMDNPQVTLSRKKARELMEENSLAEPPTANSVKPKAKESYYFQLDKEEDEYLDWD
jgi:hypothetical protein